MLLFLLLVPIGLHAQDYVDKEGELQTPRVYVTAGSFIPELTTSLRVDSKLGLGTELNLEDLFRLESQMAVFRGGGLVRLSKRSHIAASFTTIRRSNTISLETDLDFGDTTFSAGALATLRFDVNYFSATYRYSLFEKPNWNAGLSAGLRFVQFNTSLDAKFNQEQFSESAKIGAPAVLFGLHGSAYLTPRLLGRYSWDYFYLEVAGMNLRVVETNVNLQYFITKKLGLGAGYAGSNYKVREIPLSDSFRGEVTFAFEGFTLFASFRL